MPRDPSITSGMLFARSFRLAAPRVPRGMQGHLACPLGHWLRVTVTREWIGGQAPATANSAKTDRGAKVSCGCDVVFATRSPHVSPGPDAVWPMRVPDAVWPMRVPDAGAGRVRPIVTGHFI